MACAVYGFIGLVAMLGGAESMDQGGLVGVVVGAAAALVAVAILVELNVGSTLVASDDGLHGFRYWHRMHIPWSSVRSFEVRDLPRVRASVVLLYRGEGKPIQLSPTMATRERAMGIAEELRQARRENAGPLDQG
ncbi:MAG TPA: hypothetical protein VMG38_00650 [Trebonia sp.]|nr:hypothetical protein [Trebonia sp.]